MDLVLSKRRTIEFQDFSGNQFENIQVKNYRLNVQNSGRLSIKATSESQGPRAPKNLGYS